MEKKVFLFEWTGKIICKPFPMFYFHRQLYNVKGKFSIEIYVPFFHVYFEYKLGQY